jgi:hypothetical protein
VHTGRPLPTPALRMGLIGFRNAQYVESLLSTRHVIPWRVCAPADADALWVNGEHAKSARHHLVHVPSGQPDQPATLLSLHDLSRPTAFTLPINDGYLTPPYAFDPRLTSSVIEIFRVFEERLMPLAVELTLAQQIAERRHQLNSPVYHLNRGACLVAVLDVAGNVGFEPTLAPDQVADCHWHGRPPGAAGMPPTFVQTTMVLLMWRYAMRTPTSDLLPSKYLAQPIFFRKPPAVPRAMLRDVHLAVLASLSAKPCTFGELQQEIGLAAAALNQALAALYFAGSITTDAARAALPRASSPRGSAAPSGDSLLSAFGEVAAATVQVRRTLDTVPMPLSDV